MSDKSKLPAYIWAFKNHPLVSESYFDFDGQTYTLHFNDKFTIIIHMFKIRPDAALSFTLETILDIEGNPVSKFLNEQTQNHYQYMLTNSWSEMGFTLQFRDLLYHLQHCAFDYETNGPEYADLMNRDYSALASAAESNQPEVAND